MMDALNSLRDADPQEILTAVKDHVDAFVKETEQFDDLTMLCLVYHGAMQTSKKDHSAGKSKQGVPS